jgi:tRNA-binding EMAP/Myf-like protein
MKKKEQIDIHEYSNVESRLEITIGQITHAERVPKSHGLKLTVDFGNEDVRSVFTNLGKTHEPESLIGLTMPFITNLTPSVIKGVESQAMIMVGIGAEGQEQVGLDYIGIGTRLM